MAASMIELEINEQVQNYAKVYASLLSDEFQRKRAYASITALYALVNLLEKTDKELQTTMTIFRNPVLNEQYEVSDFYINNWHIDVRVITEGNAFLVPKCHFDNNIVPDFYAVVKVDAKLETADLIGFADAKSMKKNAYDYHYYSVLNSTLLNYAEFLAAIAGKKANNFKEEDHNLFKESFLGLLDGEIDKNIKNKVLKHLFECSECRKEFCCFSGFEMVNKNLSKFPNIINDQTLNIIGAQAVDSKQYEGKEEKIYIEEQKETEPENIHEEVETNKEEIKPSMPPVIEQESPVEDATNEETVSDILDELFNDEQPEIKTTINEDKSINTDIAIIDNDEDKIHLITDQPQAENLNLDNQDMVFLEEVQEISDDLIIKEDTDSVNELPTIENESNETEMVQKVIVDYDEFGEPIYSYITNVDNKTNDTSTEIEAINDDGYIELENYDNKEDLIQQENNEDIKPDESTKNIEDNSISEFSAEHSENYYYQTDEEKNESAPVDELQEISVDETTEYKEETYNSSSNTDLEEGTIEFVKDNDEKYEEYEEYEDKEESDTDEENTYQDDSDYDSQDIENDENDEYEDQDDFDDYDEPAKKPESSKQKLILASLVLIILLSCGGAIFFMKNINAANNPENNNTAPSQSQTELADNFAEDLFTQPEEETSQDEGIVIGEQNQEETNTTTEDQVGLEIPVTEESVDTTQDAAPDIPTPEKAAEEETLQSLKLTEKALLAQQSNTQTGDVNKVLSNAFSSTVSNISIKGVNWQCAPALFTNKVFKTYLQGLDNVLKQNLKKNILDATETPQVNNVIVKFAIDNDGNLLKSIIATSSGSKQIDNIVLQSINETLEAQKTTILSDGDQKADKYYIQIVIKL